MRFCEQRKNKDDDLIKSIINCVKLQQTWEKTLFVQPNLKPASDRDEDRLHRLGEVKRSYTYICRYQDIEGEKKLYNNQMTLIEDMLKTQTTLLQNLSPNQLQNMCNIFLKDLERIPEVMC